jgi:hypothetical protein
MRGIGRAFVVMGVPLLLGCAARRGGVDDLAGRLMIQRRYPAPHATVFAAAARAIIEEGYVIRLRDSSEASGRLVTHPRHTWVECLEETTQAKIPHPGIEAAILTAQDGDSTSFNVTAHVLKPTQAPIGRDGQSVDIALPLEMCTMTGLAQRVDSILSLDRRESPARATRGTIVMPLKLGDFALVDTQHFAMPGAGTGYRYDGPDGVDPDVYVYTGDLANFGVDTAAALKSAAGEFVEVLALGRSRGQLRDFEVKSNAATRRQISGRTLLVHRVTVEKRITDKLLDDYFHIAVARDNYIKVRTTFPRGAGTEAEVEGFVDRLLESLFGA